MRHDPLSVMPASPAGQRTAPFAKFTATDRAQIRRDAIEGEFEEVLRSMKPSKGLFEIMKSMFSDAWEQRKTQMNSGKDELRKQKLALDSQIETTLDKIMTLTNATAVSALEKRIDDLESEKLVLDEKLQNFGQPVHSFSEMFELSLRFIANPWNIWASGQLSLKRIVLKLAFSERIAYSRKTGLRTPQVSVPFEFFGISTKNMKWCILKDKPRTHAPKRATARRAVSPPRRRRRAP